MMYVTNVSVYTWRLVLRWITGLQTKLAPEGGNPLGGEVHFFYPLIE